MKYTAEQIAKAMQDQGLNINQMTAIQLKGMVELVSKGTDLEFWQAVVQRVADHYNIDVVPADLERVANWVVDDYYPRMGPPGNDLILEQLGFKSLAASVQKAMIEQVKKAWLWKRLGLSAYKAMWESNWPEVNHATLEVHNAVYSAWGDATAQAAQKYGLDETELDMDVMDVIDSKQVFTNINEAVTRLLDATWSTAERMAQKGLAGTIQKDRWGFSNMPRWGEQMLNETPRLSGFPGYYTMSNDLESGKMDEATARSLWDTAQATVAPWAAKMLGLAEKDGGSAGDVLAWLEDNNWHTELMLMNGESFKTPNGEITFEGLSGYSGQYGMGLTASLGSSIRKSRASDFFEVYQESDGSWYWKCDQIGGYSDQGPFTTEDEARDNADATIQPILDHDQYAAEEAARAEDEASDAGTRNQLYGFGNWSVSGTVRKGTSEDPGGRPIELIEQVGTIEFGRNHLDIWVVRYPNETEEPFGFVDIDRNQVTGFTGPQYASADDARYDAQADGPRHANDLGGQYIAKSMSVRKAGFGGIDRPTIMSLQVGDVLVADADQVDVGNMTVVSPPEGNVVEIEMETGQRMNIIPGTLVHLKGMVGTVRKDMTPQEAYDFAAANWWDQFENFERFHGRFTADPADTRANTRTARNPRYDQMQQWEQLDPSIQSEFIDYLMDLYGLGRLAASVHKGRMQPGTTWEQWAQMDRDPEMEDKVWELMGSSAGPGDLIDKLVQAGYDQQDATWTVQAFGKNGFLPREWSA